MRPSTTSVLALTGFLGASLAWAQEAPPSDEAKKTPSSQAKEATPPPAADDPSKTPGLSRGGRSSPPRSARRPSRTFRRRSRWSAVSCWNSSGPMTSRTSCRWCPGLSVTSARPGVTRITLRGVNTGGVASTVGVYLDDVPFGSSTGLANGAILSGDFDTFDIARVEVLRGPQGTLYGASSIGGVMKYVPNRPSTERFETRLLGSAETVDNGDPGYSFTGLRERAARQQGRVSGQRILSVRQRLHRFDRQQPDPQPHAIRRSTSSTARSSKTVSTRSTGSEGASPLCSSPPTSSR